MIVTVLVVFIGCTLWTVFYSFTSSRSLPTLDFVGMDQYVRLFRTSRWTVSLNNLAIFGICRLIFSLVHRFHTGCADGSEDPLRKYVPHDIPLPARSVVHRYRSGLAVDSRPRPMACQKVVRDLGFETFNFPILTDGRFTIYAIVIAGLWQGTGLVMALMLAGLRNIDDEIWKAARVDGIPAWKTYLFIIIPMMRLSSSPRSSSSPRPSSKSTILSSP